MVEGVDFFLIVEEEVGIVCVGFVVFGVVIIDMFYNVVFIVFEKEV